MSVYVGKICSVHKAWLKENAPRDDPDNDNRAPKKRKKLRSHEHKETKVPIVYVRSTTSEDDDDVDAQEEDVFEEDTKETESMEHNFMADDGTVEEDEEDEASEEDESSDSSADHEQPAPKNFPAPEVIEVVEPATSARSKKRSPDSKRDIVKRKPPAPPKVRSRKRKRTVLAPMQGYITRSCLIFFFFFININMMILRC